MNLTSRQRAAIKQHETNRQFNAARALLRSLKEVTGLVEGMPEGVRIRAGLYSMPAFNRAYEAIKQAEEAGIKETP